MRKGSLSTDRTDGPPLFFPEDFLYNAEKRGLLCMKKKNDLILVIDLQNVYLPGQPWACPSLSENMGNIRKILDAGIAERAAFTRFVPPVTPQGTWEQYNTENAGINADPYLNDIIGEMKPYLEQWPLYDKSVYSSFKVREILRLASLSDRVVLTGVVAECCVLATMMDAIDLGFRTVYLTDCISGQSEKNERCIRKIAESFSSVHTLVMDSETYLAD